MGGSNSTNEQASAESNEEDPDYLPYRGGDKEIVEPMESSNLEKDAVETFVAQRSPLRQPSDAHAITVEKIAAFDNELDFFEKMALVYLLYETAEIALQNLMQLQNEAHLNVLHEWAKSCEKSDKWQAKLLEALCIIQNYQLISELGYSKKEVNDRFLPMNMNTSLYVNLRKKQLYRIFENFSNDQSAQFLAHIKHDFEVKQLTFKEFALPYLEMYALHWTTIKYISSTDFTNLSRIFKVMEMDEADLFKSRETSEQNTSVSNTDNNKCSLPSVSSATSYVDIATFSERSLPSISSGSSIQQDRLRKNSYEDNSYVVNPDHPGVCLIINQRNFYNEPEPQFTHLLPQADKLEARKGTDVDRDSLRDTFEKFRFQMIIKNDLTHLQVEKEIRKAVSQVTTNDSSLIICILSHGVQGAVYGVNSVPVYVNDIKNIMSKTNIKNLKRKPKILILQACQGTQCQQVTDDDEDEEENIENETITVDGPTTAVPTTADMLIFWATVPGYSAVRDKEKGTWFIQSLCKTINQRAAVMHFLEICTLVKRDVSDRRWQTKKETKAMVPYQESTLTRFFFLPPKLPLTS